MWKLWRNHAAVTDIQNLQEVTSKMIEEIKGKLAKELYAFRADRATTD
jgi:nuclear transport factor 2 (NTF2) superfamily protein